MINANDRYRVGSITDVVGASEIALRNDGPDFVIIDFTQCGGGIKSQRATITFAEAERLQHVLLDFMGVVKL